jgi:hypothetical protein
MYFLLVIVDKTKRINDIKISKLFNK